MTEGRELVLAILKHMTRRKLAHRMDVSEVAVSKWESGDRNVHPARIPDLKRILTWLEKKED